MNSKVEKGLNEQIGHEATASHKYLSMASWAEAKGLPGIAKFLYNHSEEERQHMMKLVKYINERGGKVTIPGLKEPKKTFKSVQEVFETVLKNEVFVSERINDLVGLTLSEKDNLTHNFLQWFVSEQLEEEDLARTNLDKLKLVGSDSGNLYLFDRDIANFQENSTDK